MKVETYKGKDGKQVVRIRFFERDTNFQKENREGEYTWVPDIERG